MAQTEETPDLLTHLHDVYAEWLLNGFVKVGETEWRPKSMDILTIPAFALARAYLQDHPVVGMGPSPLGGFGVLLQDGRSFPIVRPVTAAPEEFVGVPISVSNIRPTHPSGVSDAGGNRPIT
jgi:hypothetical protein